MRSWGRSLRARLLVGLLLLAAAAVVAADAAGMLLLRSYLMDRTDDRLRAMLPPWELTAENPPPPSRFLRRPFVADDLRWYVLDPDGTVIREMASATSPYSPPVLPRLDAAAVRERADRPFTVPGQEGGSWRVVVHPPRGPQPYTTVVAQSLAEVSSTLGGLLVIDAVVLALALGLLAVLTWTVVRIGLRPLTEMERTAQAIASGDLSRRIADPDPRTEVGRLGMALNTMLARIESALRYREASEARMRQFLADASHELRTPLTSVRGFAELYRRGGVTDRAELDRLMRRIEDEAARMGVLVQDLLLLARLGQQPQLADEPVDLLVLAADGAHDARVRDPGRPVRLADLTGDTDGLDPVVVRGDEARLRQVLANLVTNALVHTPPGTPVEIRVGRRDGEAVLEVRDSGPGIPPEHAAKVFERFYRADPSRSRAHGGAGLGLAIVAAIVNAHQGKVELDTAPGRGATFRVRLPAAPAR